MKNVKMGICFLDEDDNIISKRVIGTNWEVDTEKDLEKFGLYVNDEIASILTANMKLQLNEDTVKEMLLEIKDKE